MPSTSLHVCSCMHGETLGQVRSSEHWCASAPTEDRVESWLYLNSCGFLPFVEGGVYEEEEGCMTILKFQLHA